MVDAYTRECLALEVDTSFASRRVTRVLEGVDLTVEAGEFVVHIQPGKPTQNAYIESFNGWLREECLNLNWFQNLFDARRKVSAWKLDYNQQRPHRSLGYRTPAEFAQQLTSYGKDGDKAALQNTSPFASGVSHFPTASAAANDTVLQSCRIMP